MDTIFALASARGKAGVAIVRISGPYAFAAGRMLFGTLPEPRKSALRVLKDQAGVRIDEALILCFEKGASFSGEDVVELHVHGSQAVLKKLFSELSAIEGLRIAEPGEFTRRAFENGCLDLAQTEGLADLIDAETEAQRRQAMRILSGDLGIVISDWRTKLVRAAALLEACIDFADEEVPVDVTPEVSSLLGDVKKGLQTQINGVATAERIRDGFEVAIVGPPNIGKSTLLNTLAGRDAAITSDIAGTTRDVIEVRMDLNGIPVTLLDTAGIRETDDKIEALGVDLARRRAKHADLRVFLILPETKPEFPPEDKDIVVVSKVDTFGEDVAGISAKDGTGISELISTITNTLGRMVETAATATHERHRVAMDHALEHINASESFVGQGADMYDMAAEELRLAIRSLSSLLGAVDVEELLGEIFSRFCVGK